MATRNMNEHLLTLQPEEERHQQPVEYTPQGIIVYTPEGTILTANSSFLRMLGYASLEELQCMNVNNLYVNKKDAEQLAHTLLTKGRFGKVQVKMKRIDSHIITALVHARVINDFTGTVIKIEATFEDITSKIPEAIRTKQYVEALQSVEQEIRELENQKKKMYSILSHDLRSPFASIIGFCDLLLTNYSQIPEEELMDYIQTIKKSALSQLEYINDIVDFTKLDAKQTPLQLTQVNMYIIVRHVISSCMADARKKNIVLTSTLPPSLALRGDEQWLHQLFLNLISNAIKFTLPGGKVTISMRSQNKKGCVIDVSDTGIGIPSDTLPKLFHITNKFSTTGTSGETGTGLGLPLCKKIMNSHGGAISVSSKVGMGTTFQLTFPEVILKRPLNILIVDDDPIVRLVHSNYVEQIFPMSKSIHASDGMEAMKLVQQFMPELILTDYAMPNMNGYEMIQALKRNPNTSDIPVIVVTGHTSQANQEALLLSGARAVIVKPLLHEELSEITKKILSE